MISIKSETIIIDEETGEFPLYFNSVPSTLILQVRDSSGKEKSVIVNDCVIRSTGKIPLKEGDSISYVAVF